MLKKMAIVGGIVAVAGLGLGGAAWAESNTAAAPQAAAAATAVTASPTSARIGAGKASKAHGKRLTLVRRLEKVSHAQWVSKDRKTGTFVTHDAVRGTVSAVSAGSITIKATDGTPETFVVNSSTKVHVKGSDKATPKTAGTISEVKVGDLAGVVGTGAGSMTATHVIDRGLPKPAKSGTTTAPTTA